MLGDLINRVLLMLLGYAYPAFECYKCLENSNVDIEELLFWCRFWIVVAVFTAFEWVGDTFIFWLPFYGEAKVAAFVCLWYPGIKATSHVYGNLLRPQLEKYEPEIDKKIMEVKERAWGYVVLHWHRVFAMAQSTMFQFLAAAGQNKSGKPPPTPKASPAPPPSSRSEVSTPPKPNPGKTHFADGTEATNMPDRSGSGNNNPTLEIDVDYHIIVKI